MSQPTVATGTRGVPPSRVHLTRTQFRAVVLTLLHKRPFPRHLDQASSLLTAEPNPNGILPDHGAGDASRWECRT